MGKGWQTLASAVVSLILLSFLGSVDGYCTQGSEWIEYNGNCYYWSRTEVNWFRAELNCQQFEGHLVSMQSANENNFTQRLTQCSSSFWIGMVNTDHSLKGAVKGYEWWDGTQHNYTVLNRHTNDHFDCVHSLSDGTWRNNYCQNDFGYVCMVPATRQRAITRGKRRIQSGQQQSQDQQDASAVWWPGYTGTTDDYWDRTETTEGTSEAPTTTEDYWGRTEATGGTSEAPTTTEDYWGRTETTGGTTYPMPNTWPTETSARTTEVPTSTMWPTSTASPNKCQPGWQLMDYSCYFVSTSRTNYFNAQMSCQAMGASVTSILTRREHTLLSVALGCHSQAWIGLEKARPCFKQPNKDHCWVWMDRSPVVYFDWASGQTIDRRDAECVILDGQWKVMNCYAEHGYICKKPAY